MGSQKKCVALNLGLPFFGWHTCVLKSNSEKLEVTMQVNNAGRGVYGNFSDTDLEIEMQMIALNVSCLVCLTIAP